LHPIIESIKQNCKALLLFTLSTKASVVSREVLETRMAKTEDDRHKDNSNGTAAAGTGRPNQARDDDDVLQLPDRYGDICDAPPAA
jgi:hypothetical protein